MNQLFAIKTPNFSKAIFTLDYASDGLFIDFLKQSYNDLCICWNDPQDYSQGGERTFFSEVFIQQFKLFSKMTKLLQFKWVEKKLNNTDYSWLVKKDYIKKDVQLKLLDGIGIMKKKNTNFIMLESSGVGQDVLAHTLEDTIKNLKHGTDSLTSILCEYKDCNMKTAKNIVVLTGHVIGEKLTIIKYSPGENRKWNAVETRSCVVPLTFERRKESIKLFELFAYIYLTLEQQEKVYDQLTNEKLGFESVKEEMVQNSACFI
ncbi:uncharacterized protein B0P05DRAFT_468782 [Gilbertella persicaria]|uniref:uncharacterized protein n=1 Tax=Gilbertella persicaria TaxID=101096 RepID=UPI002220E36A|nr:uncharacterized protein B0P05DRAFT_468782 [Gilbertella persicaria]KAI8080853.1 hypothetical protein B0P05DRAFT_468782 [Gilbertella persicaria]